MKKTTWFAIPMALSPLLLMTPTAQAANADGLYLGIGGGYGEVASSDSDIGKFAGADGSNYRVDDDDSVYKAFVGYEYNPYFATEAFYADLGKPNLIRGGNVVDLKSKAYGLSLVGKLPVGAGFELFAKAGMARWETDARGNLGAASNDLDDNDGIDPVYGAGVQFRYQHLLLRTEYERYDFDSDFQVDTYTASVGWQF
ncbi:outer membrane beta-barrel protein [Salinicola corii]|uniref:Outer membrane beta-barrel protein n=1 Tax=Salinicola corii TaxID=2606937 RepID=A0A640WDF5_9GAMM|nr:outer membrane beta-barrel protein [Salinicola corii]KAA0017837.1 outer membrane beta-barrel protein [Salinicola corii]MAM58099.1 cell envelope biogenesis protein OmpA [Salinicola sp.]